MCGQGFLYFCESFLSLMIMNDKTVIKTDDNQ